MSFEEFRNITTEQAEAFLTKIQKLNNLRSLSVFLKVPYQELKRILLTLPPEEKYKEFTIPKKNGSSREIAAPVTELREIQEKVYKILSVIYILNTKASTHGFVIGRDIVTNASQHCQKKFVLNIDIKDFFPSISQKRIRGVLMSPPYSLTNKVATSLSHLCCYNRYLPQGAPTSPVVSNLVCGKLDSELRLLAKKYRCDYTRYADDITFSTTSTTFPEALATITGKKPSDVSLGEELRSVFQENGFEINFDKVRIQRENQKQEVTGLIVNQKPNVSRKYIRQVRAMLYDWHKHGYVQANLNHQNYRLKHHKKTAHLFYVLRGKIEFIGKVKGKENQVYQKLLTSYRILFEREVIRQRALNFNDDYYNYWCQNIDNYVSRTLINYIEQENVSNQKIIEGFEELKKLKRGQDPDYDLIGVPVAYTFLYISRKIIAMTAILLHYFQTDNIYIPKTVLDIGSGTDAVSIALGLFRKNIALQVTAIEPSSCMRRFASYGAQFPNVAVRNISGSIENWSRKLGEESYDLIILSSVLQNSFKNEDDDWWLQWTQDLYEKSTSFGRLIIVEPSVKANLMQRMKGAMEEVGWHLNEELNLSDLLPQVSRKGKVLEQLTSLQEQLIGDYSPWSVRSWNTHHTYDEYIYIYQK
ncbi:MAG: reverse transcriptase domain-containing protein [Halothece sp.]